MVREFLDIIIYEEEENYFHDYDFKAFFYPTNSYLVFDKYCDEINSMRFIHGITIYSDYELKRHLVYKVFIIFCNEIAKQIDEINEHSSNTSTQSHV